MEGDDDTPNEQCLAHSDRWRTRFQCILNQLRKCHAIDVPGTNNKATPSFCGKVTSAVCTCTNREYDTRWNSVTEQQFEEAEKYFEDFLNTQSQCQEIYALLEFHYRSLRNEGLVSGSSSARRFFYVFLRARRERNTELLAQPKPPSTTPEDDRRQRQVVHLKSLKPDQVSLFMGANGRNMRRYLRGKKKVKVEMKTEGNDVQALVTCRAQDRESIRERLEREAEMLAERRRIHDRAVREWQEQQGQEQQGQMDVDQASGDTEEKSME